jgi:hypothetical protein
MVRVPPSATWDQRRADLYALAEQWLPAKSHTEATGLEHVVRRYLGGFGPASAGEIADWAGIPATKGRRSWMERPSDGFATKAASYSSICHTRRFRMSRLLCG